MRKILRSARWVVTGLLLFLVSVSANAQATPAAGQAAPNFRLTAQDGSSVSLSSLRGQWVVVFFYPSTTDSGSVTEVKAFEGDLAQYSKSGTVLGISTSSTALQLKLASATGATFPLLSDPGGKTAQTYGSLSTKGTANRNTFLIDPQGNVSQVWTGVAPATASTQVKSTLSLKPPVGSVKPTTMSLKPPVG
jgi:peroxiredoxin Q/BCP